MRCIKQVNQTRESTVVVVAFSFQHIRGFMRAMVVVMGRGVWVARLGIVTVSGYR